MKVVFLKDVPGVASAGDVKDVAPGYARNYLLARQLAVAATPAELARVDSIRRAAAQRRERAQDDLRRQAEQLEGLTVTVGAKVGAEDKLYGSVTAADIAQAVAQASGMEVDKRKVELEEPIKRTGEYSVPVRFSHDIIANVKVVVQQEQG